MLKIFHSSKTKTSVFMSWIDQSIHISFWGRYDIFLVPMVDMNKGDLSVLSISKDVLG